MQSSTKRHLINLGVKVAEEKKKTLAVASYNSWNIFRKLRTTIFQDADKKGCHNSKVNNQYF